MATIGFHASHEQIGPARLLKDVQLAEQAGFDAAMCSDHLEPWSARQGHSGFAWSWLGAALATTSLRFGVVTAPGQRYHPVVIAHASATLASMFPGRFWMAPGSGEFMNEHITGDGWPAKEERQLRLEECVRIIRQLHDGDEVTHAGTVTVHQARLWDIPDIKPPLLVPALSVATARRAAAWADGIITVNQEPDTLRELLGAYRSSGGRGKAILQVHLSWASTEAEAVGIAHEQWRTNVFPAEVSYDLPSTGHFDGISTYVSEEQLRRSANISASTSQHVDWLGEYLGIGFDELYLHFVGQHQQPFIEAFAENVLPQVRHEAGSRQQASAEFASPEPVGPEPTSRKAAG
ncbi:TIGR03885 family FMN-dependent LLM class oxidoreductase [Arthrobacter sp. ISL-30]|uniref:TIGR03885 family FMN-dependent LLM class oxidoreductase n=1 Tax=Arthrobacter sp. ISL-30 TaxID=2819109 RepID=UPI001BE6D299|nr:TIGR03885 family FMN-dependent LLM class oxidoreductase [Arthrobacter sp. ISL-30]MBT2512322.1 TIGR03885 family FMN-dependent LLM class oxidoreductase [Arthrobacter sp. ISL-30]